MQKNVCGFSFALKERTARSDYINWYVMFSSVQYIYLANTSPLLLNI